ncbi:unnamed protein product [Didymodactylos carnosus]|uniref:Uncharacterized protein n=1 Tax=Didymodactylos carnosus TaxID=1234261 RepID=A0A813TBF7_9BILA|nr:unnamed protein product [Didymodactylos carnosus]CAF1326674.1 unnamed protein product [Didymodactylos carnosus]CAF3595353.1 unnamed protein product [Didymodactylos carnosus]CAF4138005.1 unnamed protein product [Didymodactylos carnosus]
MALRFLALLLCLLENHFYAQTNSFRSSQCHYLIHDENHATTTIANDTDEIQTSFGLFKHLNKDDKTMYDLINNMRKNDRDFVYDDEEEDIQDEDINYQENIPNEYDDKYINQTQTTNGEKNDYVFSYRKDDNAQDSVTVQQTKNLVNSTTEQSRLADTSRE